MPLTPEELADPLEVLIGSIGYDDNFSDEYLGNVVRSHLDEILIRLRSGWRRDMEIRAAAFEEAAKIAENTVVDKNDAGLVTAQEAISEAIRSLIAEKEQ